MDHQLLKLAEAGPANAAAQGIVDRALRAVREHLGMPVAYLSEFVGEDSVFRNVDAPGLEGLIKPGDSRPLDEVYCRHILDGRLPELIPDTSAIPLAQSMDITKQVPIGSHVSLPVHRSDGSVFGMFCCLSPEPNPTLNERDLKVMRIYASLVADHVRTVLDADTAGSAARQRITSMVEARGFDVAYQPIYDLNTGRLTGFEALSRFRSNPYRSPDKWFADAGRAGMRPTVDAMVIERALDGFRDAPGHLRLSVNVSPETVASGELNAMIAAFGPARVTLEVTERERIGDIVPLARSVAYLQGLGALVAVDDMGGGYAGLHQILRLRPKAMKLDMGLVRDIDTDAARRALAAAMVHFAKDAGLSLSAGGIETRGERDVLRDLGIGHGQGFLMGEPASTLHVPETMPG